MIVHDVDQGTVEWMQLRLGIPTASQFDRILTPKSQRASAAQRKYRAEIVAEWLMGQPLEWGTNGWMERGLELEGEARSYYAFQTDRDVEQVGFITRDDGLVGGSPDGLIGERGILEVKCPKATTHVEYMLGDDPDYIGQCQGLLYLTGREWVDVLSYNPELPSVVNRVERDEEYLEALVPVLDDFIESIEDAKERLSEHRVSRPWGPEIQAEMAEANASQRSEAWAGV